MVARGDVLTPEDSSTVASLERADSRADGVWSVLPLACRCLGMIHPLLGGLGHILAPLQACFLTQKGGQGPFPPKQ